MKKQSTSMLCVCASVTIIATTTLSGCSQFSELTREVGAPGIGNLAAKISPFSEVQPPPQKTQTVEAKLKRGNISYLESEEGVIDSTLEALKGDSDIVLAELFESEVDGSDKGLYFLERGRISQLYGDNEFSKDNYAGAIQVATEQSEKAKVSLSDIGANAAALLVNDNVIPYRAPGFERVMMHQFQAWNYLANGDLSGAAVEVRRANREQEEALKLYEKEVEKAKEDAKGKGFSLADFTQDLNPIIAMMDESAGKVKSSFQNAYTFYFSGVIREAIDEPNDAYIDYKKALEIYPENSYVAADVTRLANSLGMQDDLTKLKGQYPEAFAKAENNHNGKGESEVVVLFEDDLITPKTAVSVPLPIPQVGLSAVSFPIYKSNLVPSHPVSITANGESLGETETICLLDALAAKALQEELPAIAIRQVLRTMLKGAATGAAMKHGKAFGAVMTAYTQLSEQGDVRGWRTLPHNAQVLRAPIASGKIALSITHPSATEATNVELEIPQGSKAIVRVTRIGNKMNVEPVIL